VCDVDAGLPGELELGARELRRLCQQQERRQHAEALQALQGEWRALCQRHHERQLQLIGDALQSCQHGVFERALRRQRSADHGIGPVLIAQA
jgi:hypothetical protein